MNESTFEVCYHSLELARADYEKALVLSQELGYQFMSQLFEGQVKSVDSRKALIQAKQKGSLSVMGSTMFSPQRPKDVLVTEQFARGGLDPKTLADVETLDQQVQQWLARMHQQGIIVQDLSPSDLFSEGLLAEAKSHNDVALAKYLNAVDLRSRSRAMADMLTSRLPYDPGSSQDLQMVEHLQGWSRTYGHKRVYVKRQANQAISGTVEWGDVFLQVGNQGPVDVSQCDGAQCGQPSLSEDGRLLVFVKAKAE